MNPSSSSNVHPSSSNPPNNVESARNVHPVPFSSSTRPVLIRNDSSSDRKRRLTSPLDHGRQIPYRMSSSSSRLPPLPRSPFDSSHHTLHNRSLSELISRSPPPPYGPVMADIVPSVPAWQSDDDVQACPICGQEFTLFFRKHHCRKCGRVVCGECSKHRISIPHGYIVQPPWNVDSNTEDPTGAESVRVCNPCVPDPWTPPGTAQSNRTNNERPQLPLTRYDLPSQTSHPTLSSRPMHRQSASLSHLFQHEGARLNHSAQQGPNLTAFLPPPAPPRYGSVARDRRSYPLPPRPDDFQRPPPMPPRSEQRAPPPPRKVVKEEDECPVCGVELPPGEVVREQHVQECISTRFGASSSTPRPISAMPDGNAAHSPSSSSPVVSSRLRSQSYRSRGLYQYKATEKDCIDGDGSEQECPICMEEFQPGDVLGRLECLCRFHHQCIRDWWVRKGPGMCPVHATHE